MRKSICSLFLWSIASLLAIPLPVTGQLLPSFGRLQSLLSSVQVDNATINQSVEAAASQPYRLRFRIGTTIGRGSEQTEEYELNLALLDTLQISIVDSRNKLSVSLAAQRDPLILRISRSSQGSYVKSMMLQAGDADQARELVTVVKRLVREARPVWEADAVFPQDLQGIDRWLNEQIGQVSFLEQAYEQSWRSLAEGEYELAASNAKTGQQLLAFSPNDMTAASLRVQARGDEVQLSLSTQRSVNLVRCVQDGTPCNYRNAIVLRCRRYDQALLIAKALQQWLLLQQQQARPPARVRSREEAMTRLAVLLKDFSIENTSYQQQVSGDRILEWTQQINSSQKLTDKKYRFHPADIDTSQLLITTRGATAFLEINCLKRLPYIEQSEGGNRMPFVSSIDIPMPDIPAARQLQLLLRQLRALSPADIAPANFSWLAATVAEYHYRPDMKQVLSQPEGSACKWLLQYEISSSRGGESSWYEFSLQDINPNQIRLDVSGREVSVRLNTHGEQALIKLYTAADKYNFERSLAIYFNDIDAAKRAEVSIRALLQSCQ
jgi:hypothetical protein